LHGTPSRYRIRREDAPLSELFWKNLDEADERTSLPSLQIDLVEIGDLTVGRTIQQPGWRWSTHVKPLSDGEWCQIRHVGIVLSGVFGVEMDDGSSAQMRAGDVYHVPPGHDGFVVGSEPLVAIEWSGIRHWTSSISGLRTRMLRTILFTDLVSSTERLRESGDTAWRERISEHFEAAREILNRHGGVEVKTTGDGILATFDGTAQALQCAAAIIANAGRQGLDVRAGVHVGEVELVGKDIVGTAVHEAARIMSEAGASEIYASEITRTLAIPAGMRFKEIGERSLKGFDEPVKLFVHLPGTGLTG
jgi:class 3 adenylate cyclase